MQVAARLYETDHEPFIWCDDELRRRPETLAWALSLPLGECLLVSPDITEGLMPFHLEAISEFVAFHVARTEERIA